MTSMLTRFRDEFEDDVQGRIDRLSREIASLRKVVSRRGGETYADLRDAGSDVYDEWWERVHGALPDWRRGARHARETARDNPIATAVITISVIGLLAALIARRS